MSAGVGRRMARVPLSLSAPRGRSDEAGTLLSSVVCRLERFPGSVGTWSRSTSGLLDAGGRHRVCALLYSAARADFDA